MSMTASALPSPEYEYDRLMAVRRGDAIEDNLARILASWRAGVGSLPAWLGLEKDVFGHMMQHHFPGYTFDYWPERYTTDDAVRDDEISDLRALLMENRSIGSRSEAWMADIVAVGCLGKDHLWQDLGLWQRKDLTELMRAHFAPLAARNNRDMKWKKFLYKQLCEREEVLTCRAPSCAQCADYDDCFGPEI